MYLQDIPQINLIDTILENLPKVSKATLKATLILIMGCALAALILTVATVKLTNLIVKDFQEMNRSKKAKKSLPAITGFTPKALLNPAPKVMITREQVKEVMAAQAPIKSQPIAILQPSQVDHEPAQTDHKVSMSLDELKALAKAHKVKSWASFKKPENLEAKLIDLGIFPNPA